MIGPRTSLDSGPRIRGSECNGSRPSVGVVVLHPDHGGGSSAATRTLISRLARQFQVVVYSARLPTSPIAGVRYVRLPAIPVYRFLLEFGTFRIAWAIYRRMHGVRQRHVFLLAESPLLGDSDFAYVHFHSRNYLRLLARNRRYFQGQQLKYMYQLVTHAIAGILEFRCISRAARRRTVLLTPTASLAAELRRTYGGQLVVRVIPNPVELDRLAGGPDPATRRQLLALAGSDEPCVIAVFAGGAWERKGLISVLEALRATPKQLRLLVVGPGNVRHYSRVAHALGVGDRVYFAGPQRDVEGFLKSSGLLCSSLVVRSSACGDPGGNGLWAACNHRAMAWMG